MLPCNVHRRFNLKSLEEYTERIEGLQLTLALRDDDDEDDVYYDNLDTKVPTIKLEYKGMVSYFKTLQELNEWLAISLGVLYLCEVGIME